MCVCACVCVGVCVGVRLNRLDFKVHVYLFVLLKWTAES